MNKILYWIADRFTNSKFKVGDICEYKGNIVHITYVHQAYIGDFPLPFFGYDLKQPTPNPIRAKWHSTDYVDVSEHSLVLVKPQLKRNLKVMSKVDRLIRDKSYNPTLEEGFISIYLLDDGPPKSIVGNIDSRRLFDGGFKYKPYYNVLVDEPHSRFRRRVSIYEDDLITLEKRKLK